MKSYRNTAQRRERTRDEERLKNFGSGKRMERSAVKISCCGPTAKDRKLQNNPAGSYLTRGSWESRRRGELEWGWLEWQRLSGKKMMRAIGERMEHTRRMWKGRTIENKDNDSKRRFASKKRMMINRLKNRSPQEISRRSKRISPSLTEIRSSGATTINDNKKVEGFVGTTREICFLIPTNL